MKRIAIIGGGMAGLAAAHYLNKEIQARALDIEWHLYERHDRLGGKIQTEQVDGFVIEGGPDSFITQKPWGLELCKELGLESELIPCNAESQKVYILSKGKLEALPAGFRLTVPTRIWPFVKSPLFSWGAKLRMGLEYFIPARTDEDDESVAAFITRRLGREAADKIGGPLMAGIYVADPAQLSILSTFPMFRAMEKKHGSLIRAMRAAARQPASGQPMFMSLRDGMGRLVQAITAPIADRCHVGAPVEQIIRKDDGYTLIIDGHTEHVDAVILACPLYEAARLLQPVASRAADELAALRYVSTATVSLGFRLPIQHMRRALDGFGFVIPASENRDILACTWSSTKFDFRAPEGHALFRVFLGGEGREHVVNSSDEELLAIVRRELAELLGVTDAPVLHRIYRWLKGNPQYDVGHATRMKALLADIGSLPGLHVAGSGYRGIGLPDCIHSGNNAAQTSLAHCKGP